MNYIKIITASLMLVIGTQAAVAQNNLEKKGKEKGVKMKAKGEGMTANAANGVKNMKFENNENLSGKALQTARTKFANEKATASISKIEGMSSKVTAGKAKIAAAKERLAAAKGTLSPEEFSAKQAKITAAESKLNGFESSLSANTAKAKAAKEKLAQFSTAE